MRIVSWETREEWLELRRAGIGGSDIGAIMGLSPYSDAFQVWADKMGMNEQSDNPAMARGRALEAGVARLFAEEKHCELRDAPQELIIDEHLPICQGSVDRWWDPDAIVEIKTTSWRNAHHWEDGEVPPHYEAQLRWYMMIAERPVGYLVCLVGGEEVVIVRFERDAIFEDAMRAEAETFWQRYVIPHEPPPPGSSPRATEVLGRLWKPPYQDTIEVDEATLALVRKRHEAKAAADETKAKLDEIDNGLKLAIADHEVATYHGTTLYTWRNTTRSGLDTKKLLADHPELEEQYKTTTSYRRLDVKKGIEE